MVGSPCILLLLYIAPIAPSLLLFAFAPRRGYQLFSVLPPRCISLVLFAAMSLVTAACVPGLALGRFLWPLETGTIGDKSS